MQLQIRMMQMVYHFKSAEDSAIVVCLFMHYT